MIKKIKVGFFGRKHSEESKRKMSESHSGNKHCNYGGHHSEETKRKMIENHADFSGENNPLFGKNHSDITKAKMSVAHAKSWKTFEYVQKQMKSKGCKPN